MATIHAKLKGKDTIDNAVIYLEDPQEKIPYYFKPISNTEWETDHLKIPIQGYLDYSLHVLAYSGTAFECVITNEDNGNTITLKGVTGNPIRSRANIKGSQQI
jgi:hypothetical protein